MLSRTIFTDEHDLYRAAAREFFEKEVAPFHDEWDKAGMVPRELWEKAGAQGHLAHTVPEEFGGPAVDDFRVPARITQYTIPNANIFLVLTILLLSRPSISFNASLVIDVMATSITL